ncbi:hypothetical protein [Methylobacterium oxalidis]|uniref:Uncharacterized protein n=1 Tax=Methylobacterium oxalidis TaxID=944322 RepID=A0A512IWJ7_9HYPH|nr:hypothetical protein [Methylobacterium oxalidis]GEP02065.1 hypothetical protein MOX02_01030 [Methylobacterium oxalidis]GJE31880.1 hypothetical protein LDDCCGHA_2062 [Methylobacterium oxalidis]GLS62010.1 hypothetical protein GCM10007888_03910 [Methylobacterium oxalidis]
MPVFDAKNLDSSFEGQALLTALLHPTRAEQARARINGRRRAVRAAAMTDPMVVEPRFPVRSDDLAATPVPTT